VGPIDFPSSGALPVKRCEANIFFDYQRRYAELARIMHASGRSTCGVPIEARP